MARSTLTSSKRQSFEKMFVDMNNPDKELRSRATYSVMNPLSTVLEITNRYKQRLAYSLEVKNAVYGLAAVQAFQQEMMEYIAPEQHKHELRRDPKSPLRKATDTASFNKISKELDVGPFFEQNSTLLALDEWLGEKLIEMDHAILEQKNAEEVPEDPAPRI